MADKNEDRLSAALADVAKADEERREAAAKAAKEATAAAREASEATLAEQSAMVPEPSQEEADLIKVGALDPLERKAAKQPDGPAAEAERQLAADNAAAYKTRSVSAKK